ncbi:UNVERIFIED_CONTAM: hypothetical protein Sradi_5409100 [Sesamum radiatum]|uniref:Uncharacterized protein n=1 Tax=Sesamum radiatum TaxID=300843 RepID=A0AAW2L9R2_SESRA
MRSDTSFYVFKLVGYASCHDRTHWGVLDRVLRSLTGTMSLAINYDRFPTVLEGYSYASWIAKNSYGNGCPGYAFTLRGGTISWKSSKQTLITRSTFKSELYALDTIGTEAEWLYGLLSQPLIASLLPLLGRTKGQRVGWKNSILIWEREVFKTKNKVEVEQLQQENQQLCDQIDDLKEHTDQLAEIILDDDGERHVEDPIEYPDDDGELTDGSIVD